MKGSPVARSTSDQARAAARLSTPSRTVGPEGHWWTWGRLPTFGWSTTSRSWRTACFSPQSSARSSTSLGPLVPARARLRVHGRRTQRFHGHGSSLARRISRAARAACRTREHRGPALPGCDVRRGPRGPRGRGQGCPLVPTGGRARRGARPVRTGRPRRARRSGSAGRRGSRSLVPDGGRARIPLPRGSRSD